MPKRTLLGAARPAGDEAREKATAPDPFALGNYMDAAADVHRLLSFGYRFALIPSTGPLVNTSEALAAYDRALEKLQEVDRG